MANSVNSDQTAPFKEQSDLGLHCLLSDFCWNIWDLGGILLTLITS